jgi:hypothetical protein
MNPILESLVKAYEAFLLAGDGPEAPQLRELYDSRLKDVAEETRVEKELLHRSVRRQYLRWLRAQHRPPTV